MAIGVECRSVATYLSGRSPKGEPDAPITAARDEYDMLPRLGSPCLLVVHEYILFEAAVRCLSIAQRAPVLK
jgi:hypothetical protein